MKNTLCCWGLLLSLVCQSQSDTVTIQYGYDAHQGGALYPSTLPLTYSASTHEEYQQHFQWCDPGEWWARKTLEEAFGLRDSSFGFGDSSLSDFDTVGLGNDFFSSFDHSDSAFYGGSAQVQVVHLDLMRLPTRITVSHPHFSPQLFNDFKNNVVTLFAMCVLADKQIDAEIQAEVCQQLKTALVQGRLKYSVLGSPNLFFRDDCPRTSVVLHNRRFTLRVLQKANDVIARYKQSQGRQINQDKYTRKTPVSSPR